MDKVIPILPCPDIRTQTSFFELLGFQLTGIYTSPNPYACMTYGSIELHFYGSRKTDPSANSTMCFIMVDDVDVVYEAFADGLKKNMGKVPRSGIPRISKVRDLANDRRFTLTDTGGNTYFVGTPVHADSSAFFRTLQNQDAARKFAVLYDLVFSKEDFAMAEKMLPKFDEEKDFAYELDNAKYQLLNLEIQQQQGQPLQDAKLKELLDAHHPGDASWEKIRKRYIALLHGE